MARKIYLVCGLFLWAATAVAQSPEHLHETTTRRVYDGPPLTLDEALAEALQRNPELVALRQQFDAVQHRPAQERFLMPPSFEAQIWQWPLTTINPLNVDMYMFTLQQELPGRGKREARVAVADKDVALASADIAVRARDVIKEVQRAYVELALARKAIDIHLESVGLLRQSADVSTVKYAAGRSLQQDVLKAVVELSRLHEDLVTHEESAAAATARLNTLLDRDPHTPIGPVDPLREDVVVPPSDELQRLAVAQHPELRAAQLGIERAHAVAALVDREYHPDFFVGGGYMLRPRSTGAWTASVGVTWPNAPWSRGRLDAQKAEAAADVTAAAARLRVVERQIRLAVHDAYVRAEAAGQRASLLRTTVVPQSQQAMEVSRVAYQGDRVDFLSVVDNQRVLLDARLSYFRVLADREIALADLSRAVGTGLPGEIVRPPSTPLGPAPEAMKSEER